MGYVGDAKREYQLNWVKKRRTDWIESQGGKCIRCSSVDQLQVDHIDPSLKTMNPASIWSRREEVRDKELANCQVLCSPCHKEKSKAERATLPYWHGVRQMYDDGCRCKVCVQCHGSKVDK